MHCLRSQVHSCDTKARAYSSAHLEIAVLKDQPGVLRVRPVLGGRPAAHKRLAQDSLILRLGRHSVISLQRDLGQPPQRLPHMQQGDEHAMRKLHCHGCIFCPGWRGTVQMLSTVPTINWVSTSLTGGKALAAFACSLAAYAPCLKACHEQIRFSLMAVFWLNGSTDANVCCRCYLHAGVHEAEKLHLLPYRHRRRPRQLVKRAHALRHPPCGSRAVHLVIASHHYGITQSLLHGALLALSLCRAPKPKPWKRHVWPSEVNGLEDRMALLGWWPGTWKRRNLGGLDQVCAVEALLASNKCPEVSRDTASG